MSMSSVAAYPSMIYVQMRHTSYKHYGGIHRVMKTYRKAA